MWQTTLLLPAELELCEHRLRGSTLAALAAGHTSSAQTSALSTAEMALKLEASTDLPMRMLARGLAMFDEPARVVVVGAASPASLSGGGVVVGAASPASLSGGVVVGAASPASLSDGSGTSALRSSSSSSDAMREETEGRACALLLQVR